MTPSTIAVVGIGRIGCVTAACLAHAGHTVRGIDIDEARLSSIRSRQLPFHEPQLLEVITESLDRETLTLTSDLVKGVTSAGFVMLCIGTESLDGHAVVTPLLGIVDRLVQAHRDGLFNGTIVIRSTVPPGTCHDLLLPLLEGTRLNLVFQPEFLREGNSVKDFIDPSLLVVGSVDPVAATLTAEIYGASASICQHVTLREAELIKYACNAFHGLKIAFANEVGTLSESLGARGREVMRVLALDTRLNASAAYLRPGFAFGGYCLPKDSQVLASCAHTLDLDLPVIAGILPSNTAHLARSIAGALSLDVTSIGVFGISFKAGTDDLRASPALYLAEALLREGRTVHLFDPSFAPGKGNASAPKLPATLAAAHLHNSFEAWIAPVEAIVLTQQPDIATAGLIAQSRLPVSDCFGTLPTIGVLPPSDHLPPPSPPSPLIAPRGPLRINSATPSAIALSIIVPTYQESASIRNFLYTLSASLDAVLPGDYEIVIVDDDSPDRTWQIATDTAAALPQVKVVRRQNERGLATAVIRGWQASSGHILGTINADFQHPPDLAAALWSSLIADDARSLAIATRYAHGGGVGDWSLPRRVFSKAATLMARLMLPKNLRNVSDPMSGCYLFRRSLIAGIELNPKGYKTLVEILVRSKSPLRLVEVPYQMEVRTAGQSKANLWRSFDFIAQLWRLRAAAKLKV